MVDPATQGLIDTWALHARGLSIPQIARVRKMTYNEVKDSILYVWASGCIDLAVRNSKNGETVRIYRGER